MENNKPAQFPDCPQATRQPVVADQQLKGGVPACAVNLIDPSSHPQYNLFKGCFKND